MTDENLNNTIAWVVEALDDLKEALTCLKDRLEERATGNSSLTDEDIERIKDAVRPPWPPYQVVKIDDDPFTRPTVID